MERYQYQIVVNGTSSKIMDGREALDQWSDIAPTVEERGYKAQLKSRIVSDDIEFYDNMMYKTGIMVINGIVVHPWVIKAEIN